MENIVSNEANSHIVVKVAFVESVSVSKQIAFLAAYPGERFLSLFVQQIKAGRLLTCIDRRIDGLGCEVLQISFHNAPIWDCSLDIKKMRQQ
jgi:hypothetical protein